MRKMLKLTGVLAAMLAFDALIGWLLVPGLSHLLAAAVGIVVGFWMYVIAIE